MTGLEVAFEGMHDQLDRMREVYRAMDDDRGRWRISRAGDRSYVKSDASRMLAMREAIRGSHNRGRLMPREPYSGPMTISLAPVLSATIVPEDMGTSRAPARPGNFRWVGGKLVPEGTNG